MLAFLNGVVNCNFSTCSIMENVKNYEIIAYEHINDVPKSDWDLLLPSDRTFLHRPYLSVLEKAHPNMEFRYVLIRKKEETVGVALFKLVDVSGKNLRLKNSSQPVRKNGAICPIEYVGELTKGMMFNSLNKFNLRLLVCGNAFITGEHGFYYNSLISDEEAFFVLNRALESIQKQESEKGKPVSLVLAKDFHPEKLDHTQQFRQMSYQELFTLPNMVLNLHPDWKDFKDYLASMSSKYRVRAKKVRKKGAKLVKKVLSLDEIKVEIDNMHRLYKKVADKAGFNLAYASSDYFVQLKEELGEKYDVLAYYLDEKLVGFISIIDDAGHLEAHYMGSEDSLNRNFALYNNILFDVVEEGIKRGVKAISFGRTAPEIKSTVGATAVQMSAFLKHRSFFPNNVIMPLFNYLKQEEWVPRQPFKQEYFVALYGGN